MHTRRGGVFVAVLLGLGVTAYGCGGDDSMQTEIDGSSDDGSVLEGAAGDATDGTTGADGARDAPGDHPSDTNPPTDSAGDAPTDSPPLDMGRDMGVDTGVDTGVDAGIDAREDTGVDAGIDTGVDTGVDTGADTGSDSGMIVVLDVVQHHNNPSRDGVYVDSAFTHAVAGGIHRDASFGGALTGDVYAQPLFVKDGPNAQPAFIVATEMNHVTALNDAGAVIWDKTFGAPVMGGLPCGNILPLGITGTPYLDKGTRTIYFDAMTEGSNGPEHMVYGISLDDGATRSGWPVNVNAKVSGFDSSHQNERGAVQLIGGVLYLPYGGLAGDCDPYNGWVVAISTSNPTATPTWYKTAAARGGIWASGSLPSDGTSIFPVTGNTEGTTTWGGGEAVLRLGAGATFSGMSADYFTPSNWVSLDGSDLDLGGANDFLLDMPGAPVPHLVVAPGKDQNLYLLNRDNLGGMGSQLAKTHVATNEMNAAGAAYHTAAGAYVAVRVANGGHGNNCPVGGGGNLAVAKISATNPPTASVVWCSDEANLGSPMVTTTNGSANVIVWAANNRLYGYDGDTGTKVFAGGGASDAMAAPLQYMNTFIDTGSRIAIAVSGKLYVFH